MKSHWLIVIHADTLDGYVAVRKACDDGRNGIKIIESREVITSRDGTEASRKSRVGRMTTKPKPGEKTQVQLFYDHVKGLGKGATISSKEAVDWCLSQKSERFPDGFKATGASALTSLGVREGILTKVGLGLFKVR